MPGNHDASAGMQYFMQGLRWLTRPGLRRYVIIPLIINIVLFVALFWLGLHYFSEFVQWIDHFLPKWLRWLSWLLWIIFGLSFLIVMVYTFTLIANLIAAPFNGLLAEKVELLATGKKLEDTSWAQIVKEIPRALKRQLQFILYYLPRAILGLICFFIPVVQVAAGPLWFLFNSWMMSVQYIDYPMDNHRIEFKPMLHQLRDKRGLNFGFGMASMVATMIPFVNFIAMPASVIGATLLWVDAYSVSD